MSAKEYKLGIERMLEYEAISW